MFDSVFAVALDVAVLHFVCAAHYATWESAVHGFSDAGSLAKVRKELKAKRGNAVIPTVGPRLPVKTGTFKEKRMGKWAAPFPGSRCVVAALIVIAFSGADAAVVRCSQFTIAERKGKGKSDFSLPQCKLHHRCCV